MPPPTRHPGQTGRMADLHVHRSRFELRMSRVERTLSFHRDPIVIERDDIRSVAITEDPWTWIRGIRAPGTFLPLTLAAGTWKFHGGRDFLLIKGKQRTAVVIDVEGADWSRVIVSTPRASELIEALRIVDASQAGPAGDVIPGA